MYGDFLSESKVLMQVKIKIGGKLPKGLAGPMHELLGPLCKTGGGSAANLILGILAIKVMAVVLGPAGVGLFSLLRQTQQTALTLAVLNGQMAVVQGTAMREEKARAEYLATVLGILILTGSVVSLGVFVFAPQLAAWIIGQTDASTVRTVRWLSLSIFLSTAASYLTSLLNGYRAIGRVALSQIASFGLMASLAYPTAFLVKIGYPMAFAWLFAASGSASLVLGLWFALRSDLLAFLFDKTKRRFNRPAAQHFLRMAGTMLLTGFVGTAVPLAVRSLAARRFGLYEVGIFDVAWTLSMAYTTLILTFFSTYYLPTLSQTRDLRERQILVYQVLRLSILLMFPLIIAVIAFKPLVVELLYTSDFLPSLKIMRWMLIGDCFKVLSWVFGYTMIAYSDMRTYLMTEIIWGSLMLCGSAISVLSFNSLQGIGVSFIALYVTYLGYTCYYVYNRNYLKLDKRIIMQWLIGIILVLSVSTQTWNDSQVNWSWAMLWLIASLFFIYMVLNFSERQKLIL